jgi:hypothetical protein
MPGAGIGCRQQLGSSVVARSWARAGDDLQTANAQIRECMAFFGRYAR